MTDLEFLKKIYNDFKEQNPECNKRQWFTSYFLNLTTYDDEVDEYFYNYCIPVIKELIGRTCCKCYHYPFKGGQFNFKWNIKDEKYIQYLTVCNLILGSIEWGTSIRTAWWDEPIVPILDIDVRDLEYLRRGGYIKLTTELMVDLINWVEE
jgi:hypothetical protein